MKIDEGKWTYHFSIEVDVNDKPRAAFYTENKNTIIGPFDKSCDSIDEIFDSMKSIVKDHREKMRKI